MSKIVHFFPKFYKEHIKVTYSCITIIVTFLLSISEKILKLNVCLNLTAKLQNLFFFLRQTGFLCVAPSVLELTL